MGIVCHARHVRNEDALTSRCVLEGMNSKQHKESTHATMKDNLIDVTGWRVH